MGCAVRRRSLDCGGRMPNWSRGAGPYISTEVHGGAGTTTEVVGECVIWVVAIATATAVGKHHNEESFH